MKDFLFSLIDKGVDIAFVGGSDRKKALEQLDEDCKNHVNLSIIKGEFFLYREWSRKLF